MTITRGEHPCWWATCDYCNEGDGYDLAGSFHYESEQELIESLESSDWKILRNEEGSVRAVYCFTCWGIEGVGSGTGHEADGGAIGVAGGVDAGLRQDQAEDDRRPSFDSWFGYQPVAPPPPLRPKRGRPHRASALTPEQIERVRAAIFEPPGSLAARRRKSAEWAERDDDDDDDDGVMAQ